MPQTTQRRNVQAQLNELLATSKNKSYFVGAITVLFVILMVLLGILPSYTAFTTQGEVNVRRQDVIDKLEKKRTTLENLVRQETEKKNLFNKFNAIFPDEPVQVAVLNEIEALAVKEKNLLLNSSFTEARTNADVTRKFSTSKQVKAQTLTVLMEGDRQSLVNFVRDVEMNLRVLDIKNMVISRKVGTELEEAAPDRQYKLNIQLDYFYYDKEAR